MQDKITDYIKQINLRKSEKIDLLLNSDPILEKINEENTIKQNKK